MLDRELSSDDLVAAQIELCNRHFAEFVKQAWHIVEPSTPLKWGWMLDGMSEHLQAISDGDLQNVLFNVPPGAMKSLMVCVFWPAWEWGPRKMPEKRFLGASHEQGLAIRDNWRCRNIIRSEWYQTRWPVALSPDQDGKKDFSNLATGFRNARAFESMTGARGDRVLLDDPISAKKANSEAHLKETELIFNETLPTRINDADTSSIVVIMQRLHERDPSGLILSQQLDYEHFCIPMEFETERRCSTSIGWKDPRKKEGELMFPERFSAESIEKLKRQLGTYGTAGQLQQRPAPRGGGIIKERWWKWYLATAIPKVAWRMIYADTAQKEKQENDFSVLQCWGMRSDGEGIVLLDQLRGKWEAPDLTRNARQFWNKHKAIEGMGALRQMKVEDKVSGTGLIQALKRPYDDEGKKRPAIPVVGIQRNVDKVSRAYGAAPQIEAGFVYLPEDAEWIHEYISELNTFPAGAHDDQCDPTFDAIEDMLIASPKRPAPGGVPPGAVGPSVIEG